jgi:hypothetical protein
MERILCERPEQQLGLSVSERRLVIERHKQRRAAVD